MRCTSAVLELCAWLLQNGYCAADCLDDDAEGRSVDAIVLSLGIVEMALGASIEEVDECIRQINEMLHTICAGTRTLITFQTPAWLWDYPVGQVIHQEALQVPQHTCFRRKLC